VPEGATDGYKNTATETLRFYNIILWGDFGDRHGDFYRKRVKTRAFPRGQQAISTLPAYVGFRLAYRIKTLLTAAAT
jgi:hypothetical protein